MKKSLPKFKTVSAYKLRIGNVVNYFDGLTLSEYQVTQTGREENGTRLLLNPVLGGRSHNVVVDDLHAFSVKQ